MQKTILITGSTDGIGKLAAMQLAKQGHSIYVHGRNSEKLLTTIAEIKTTSENEAIKGIATDLSDLKAVKQMADDFKREQTKIDVLINNAGVYKSPASVNNDGLDIRIVVNYLAPYLLTKQLIPLLKYSTEPRIINLSSAAQSPISHKFFLGKETVSVGEAYAQSKLALTMWSFYLAKKLKNASVIAVNPGSLLNTKMVKEAFGNHWSSAHKGADVLVDLATSEKYRGITGEYYDNDTGTFGKAHSDAYQQSEINKLIETTLNILPD